MTIDSEAIRKRNEERWIGHHECEDGWYSCPKSEEGWLRDYDDDCNCGQAERAQAKADIDAILNQLARYRTALEKIAVVDVRRGDSVGELGVAWTTCRDIARAALKEEK